MPITLTENEKQDVQALIELVMENPQHLKDFSMGFVNYFPEIAATLMEGLIFLDQLDWAEHLLDDCTSINTRIAGLSTLIKAGRRLGNAEKTTQWDALFWDVYGRRFENEYYEEAPETHLSQMMLLGENAADYGYVEAGKKYVAQVDFGIRYPMDSVFSSIPCLVKLQAIDQLHQLIANSSRKTSYYPHRSDEIAKVLLVHGRLTEFWALIGRYSRLGVGLGHANELLGSMVYASAEEGNLDLAFHLLTYGDRDLRYTLGGLCLSLKRSGQLEVLKERLLSEWQQTRYFTRAAVLYILNHYADAADHDTPRIAELCKLVRENKWPNIWDGEWGSEHEWTSFQIAAKINDWESFVTLEEFAEKGGNYWQEVLIAGARHRNPQVTEAARQHANSPNNQWFEREFELYCEFAQHKIDAPNTLWETFLSILEDHKRAGLFQQWSHGQLLFFVQRKWRDRAAMTQAYEIYDWTYDQFGSNERFPYAAVLAVQGQLQAATKILAPLEEVMDCAHCAAGVMEKFAIWKQKKSS
jgi:hypothetical protein